MTNHVHPESRSTKPTRKRAGVPRRLRALARDMLIVFVGVWLALVAEGWRDRRAAERRTESLVRAIRADFADLTGWYAQWRASIASDLTAWERAQTAGQQPPMYYVRIPGAEQGALIGWQIALASGALEVLDPGLVFELGRAARELEGVGMRFARYMAMTETIVFPQLARGTDPFYQNGVLKPEYAAHIALLKELLSEFDEKMGWLKSLDARLAELVVQ